MSQANLELVEGLYGGAAGMDKTTLLAALPELIAATCDPEVEWIEDPARPDSRIYRGHDGVLVSFQRWLEGFDEYGYETDEFIDCGEHVFVAGRERGRGAASGAEVSARLFTVLTLRAGKLLRYREFYDAGAARRAAGLEQ